MGIVISVQLQLFHTFCGTVSLPSEGGPQRAAPYAPGGVATPPHLPPHPGPHVEAADAAGRQPPLGGVPAPRRQTQQPGWTAAVELLPERRALARLTVLSVASLQLEEAQRKHDLLVELLRKDQEHKRRLVSPLNRFCTCTRTRCSSVTPHASNLPERVQGANPAAEDDPEQTEGTQTAGGTSQEILRGLPRPAPCTSDEDAH